VRRLVFLDGLRGWGAVFVVLYHVFCNGLPVNALADGLKYLVPFSGMLAVLVFFVVSGFSLSISYLAEGRLQSWCRMTAGRYLRLAIPIFATCAVVHLVMVFGLVASAPDRLPLFQPFFNFTPTVGHLLKFSLFDVFFAYDFRETYAGPLWTMSVELIGSFVVLFAILVLRPLPYRPLFLAALSCLILAFVPWENAAYLALFPAGAALADCFNRGWIEVIPKPVGLLLLLFGCLSPILLSYRPSPWCVFSVLPLVVGSIVVPSARAWLSGSVSAHLGRISFPLYLVHGPILCFLGEPLTREAGDGMALKILVQFAVVLLSFAAAEAFVPVNEFAIDLARRFGRWSTDRFFYRPMPAER
jgi:peptidoglycan/LPS O-acetylase OafA/YrhL